MELQAGQSPHVVDTCLNAALESEGLPGTKDDDDDLAGLENGLDTDGQGHARDLAQVVVEEARVREDGVIGKRLDTSARRQAGARLVECDVPVLTDTAEEEVDATHSLDLGLVLDALGFQIWRVAVQNVHIVGVDVHVREEVLPHEAVVALRVVPGDPDVLILASR